MPFLTNEQKKVRQDALDGLRNRFKSDKIHIEPARDFFLAKDDWVSVSVCGLNCCSGTLGDSFVNYEKIVRWAISLVKSYASDKDAPKKEDLPELISLAETDFDAFLDKFAEYLNYTVPEMAYYTQKSHYDKMAAKQSDQARAYAKNIIERYTNNMGVSREEFVKLVENPYDSGMGFIHAVVPLNEIDRYALPHVESLSDKVCIVKHAILDIT